MRIKCRCSCSVCVFMNNTSEFQLWLSLAVHFNFFQCWMVLNVETKVGANMIYRASNRKSYTSNLTKEKLRFNDIFAFRNLKVSAIDENKHYVKSNKSIFVIEVIQTSKNGNKRKYSNESTRVSNASTQRNLFKL